MLGRVLEPCYSYVGLLKIIEYIDLQKEGCLMAVEENMVGKGILFSLQLPCGCLDLCREICHIVELRTNFDTTVLGLFPYYLNLCSEKSLKVFFTVSESSLSSARHCWPFSGVRFSPLFFKNIF